MPCRHWAGALLTELILTAVKINYTQLLTYYSNPERHSNLWGWLQVKGTLSKQLFLKWAQQGLIPGKTHPERSIAQLLLTGAPVWVLFTCQAQALSDVPVDKAVCECHTGRAVIPAHTFPHGVYESAACLISR